MLLFWSWISTFNWYQHSLAPRQSFETLLCQASFLPGRYWPLLCYTELGIIQLHFRRLYIRPPWLNLTTFSRDGVSRKAFSIPPLKPYRIPVTQCFMRPRWRRNTLPKTFKASTGYQLSDHLMMLSFGNNLETNIWKEYTGIQGDDMLLATVWVSLNMNFTVGQCFSTSVGRVMMVPQQQKPTSWGDITWIHCSTATHSSHMSLSPEEFLHAVCIDAKTLDVSLKLLVYASFHIPVY